MARVEAKALEALALCTIMKEVAMSIFHKTAHEMGIKSNRPKFIRINGRMVRNTNGKEIVINSQAKGNSLAKFPARIGRIGFHKFAS